MPRKPRIEHPGGLFHLAARGVDDTTVFRTVEDRTDFIALLQRSLVTYDWQCQSYCLMSTHVHLLVQPMKATLSRGMQALCGTYGMRFNKRHGRKGHLFGSRFMSVQIESDRHLLEAHRYIARNPVRAGLCERPGEWRWGSYRAALDLDPAFQFLDVVSLLRLFDERPAVAKESFRRFVEDPREQSRLYKLAETDGV